jgi:hypothetical protein
MTNQTPAQHMHTARRHIEAEDASAAARSVERALSLARVRPSH